MREPELSTGRKVLLAAILLVGLPLVLLVILEGASSFLLLARDLAAARGTTERLHTEYDTLLGWIHRPDVDLEDIYGPGTRLRTNALRVRSIGPAPRERPEGTFRIICAGDSFTLGYGVSDERTWCHLLQDPAEGVETVNMGQGGYGLDQAYLWYVRDGLPLEHDALVFAFISDDFRRTLLQAFEGYPKPRFRVVDGRIELDNVPVPRPPFVGWRARFAPPLGDLRMSLLSGRLLRRFMPRPPDPLERSRGEIDAIVSHTVRSLGELSAREGRPTMLVYLPSPGDYGSDHSAWWRRRMAALAAESDLLFLDLVEELRRLPPDIAHSYYRAGHFNESGNAWAAAAMGRRLSGIPGLPERVGDDRATREQ